MKIINGNKLFGSKILFDFAKETGDITVFTGKVFSSFFKKPFEHSEFLKHAYYYGYNTFMLIAITNFIMGLVLTLQSRPVLVEFGAEAWLPGMVSISIIREIGPVITALICAGKIGSGIGAELGSMKVTEQIDAMEVSGTNPIKYVVASRVLATTVMVPILVIFADFIGLLGSYVAVIIRSKISLMVFFRDALDVLELMDIIPATIKSVIFGFFIGLIGCYKGYTTGQGTAAVGRSANSAVVTASLTIFIIDLVVVQIIDLLDII